jgi:hypothetical protein
MIQTYSNNNQTPTETRPNPYSALRKQKLQQKQQHPTVPMDKT